MENNESYGDPQTVNSVPHQVALFELTQIEAPRLDSYLRRVCETSAKALNINRVSIWFYDSSNTAIELQAEYHDPSIKIQQIEKLKISDYSVYFRASHNARVISVFDAAGDPLTNELNETYLKPLGITSMMDLPIWLRGEVMGIVCFEQITESREWKEEEENFAASIAELVSRAFETDRSRQKEAEYRESQRFLTTLISNLPGYVYRCSTKHGNWFVEFASEGIYDLTGFKAEEMLKDQNKYSTLVHVDDRRKQAEVVLEALRERKPYQITYRIHTAEGAQKWVWEQGRGVYSNDGTLAATEGFITDISEKKQAEEELIKRNIELSALNKIGQSLSKLAETKEIMEILISSLEELFGPDNISIVLYDEEKNLLNFPYSVINGERIEFPAIEPAKGITEYIMFSKKPLILNTGMELVLQELNVSKHSEKFPVSLIAAPMFAGDKVVGVVSIRDYEKEYKFTDSQLDILSTIASQAGIALQNANLYDEVKKSLREKEILLQEVHHRVKNNLQIMSSLVKLQSHHIKDTGMLEILRESENRIRSMAIVHTKLYNSKDYEQLDFADYVRSLTESFYTTYGMRLSKINIHIDIRDVILNIDTAIPCGLIINELVSNSIKYAFPDQREGLITISMSVNENGSYTLIVKDNGAGLPAGFNVHTSKTLGIELVTLLTNQLNGKLEIASNGGAEFKIIFEESVYKSRN